MNDSIKSKASVANLFSAIYQLCVTQLDDALQRATLFASSQIYKQIEQADDWLRQDYSLTINLLEANHEWIARTVGEKVLRRLKIESQQALANEQPTSGVQASVSEQANQESPIRQKDPKMSTGSLDGLSLVSKDDFEDWLVVNRAIRLLERELSLEIHDVCQVFSALSGHDVDLKSLAIAPENLLSELKSALDSLDLPPSLQAILYKSIASSLEKDLQPLFAQIETLAHKYGLDYKPKAVPVSGASSSTSRYGSLDETISTPREVELEEGFALDEELGLGGGVSPEVGSEGASDSVKPIRTLDTLSRLNASLASGARLGNRAVSGKIGTTQLSSDTAAVSEKQTTNLVSLISRLQQSQGNELKGGNYSLRGWLESGLVSSELDRSEIGSQASELIDVTDRFFEVIVEKIGVNGILEKWLEKLKLTILKVVLRDEDFFSDVSHPARQMLNKLAKLATSNENAGNRRLEGLLDNYIDKLVADYDQDESAVDTVVEQLNSLLERQELACKRNSERIARTYEGRQKIAEARHKVVKDLNAVLAGKSAPLVMLELLDKGGWRDHLALVAVRDGHGSENYREAFSVVEQLMNWFGPDANTDEKWALELEMELEAPSLFEMVSKELSVVGKAGLDSIMNRLEDCLFNSVEPLLVKIDKYEWPFDKTEKELEELSPKEQRGAMSSWQKRILSMKIGDWVEITDAAGKSRCLRLAWSGSESFRFVFVDSQGMKDEDVSLDELVKLFKSNRACFVEHDEVPIVDQGLHQMVQSVYEELSGQASCDLLTGLLNRQAFERGLEQSIATAMAAKNHTSLLYVDLDKFSVTNTAYGHLAGDALLKHVAHLVRESCPVDAFCGRLGGNEFGVILPGSDVQSAAAQGEAIRKRVENNAMTWDKHSLQSTVSIGVVQIDLETDNYDSVMRKAGLACESAKANGQNRVVQYQAQDQDQKKRDELLKWVEKLDVSLDEILTLRCQEIRPTGSSDSANSHWEILLGVIENGQVLPPGKLIEAAEHFGRMAKVDRWVFHNVLRWMEENSSIVQRSDGFSVNLSGNSLSDESFLEFVLGELAATNAPLDKLCFEVTETAAIANLADASEFIRILKQKGCRFSLDDFGSGLSSYAYIQRLPVDYIKIDGIFIRNLADNERDRALVKSINELAHFMGIETVAEFVESHDILNVLKDIGVDHSQGFGIKKPGLLSELR